ncbi:MAG: PepSY domain-containing protein [Steroidobacteraceae bacterium]
MKRYLYLTHRWLGIVLCLFMAMWFFSGVVMMYVGYPKLSTAERLVRLPALWMHDPIIEMKAALAATGQEGAPKEARLTTVADSPRYIFSYGKGRYVAVDARSGQRINSVSQAAAVTAAAALAKGAVHYLDQVDEDAWTHSKALDGHRPLHRVQVEDDNATLLYISSSTGEVVRDATRTERAWNWVGAWIHWLYPFRGGIVDRQWSNIVIYTSLIATILAVTGLVVGVLRWRFTGRYKNASHSPYRESFMRWHHLAGLVFGALAVTWIFSGMMSMNPWKLFDSGRQPLALEAYSGGKIEPARFAVDIRAQCERLRAEGFQAREIEWRMFAGTGFLLATDATGQTRLISPSAAEPPLAMLPMDSLAVTGARLLPGVRIVEQQIVTQYDFHYYGRAPHTMTGHVEKHLPVLRLKFDDEHHTWVHLDPYTAQVVGISDSYRRVDRVLFAFLHSWDWLPLLQHRPVWDGLLVLGSIGGFAMSLTGVVIGWRRLRRKLVFKKDRMLGMVEVR